MSRPLVAAFLLLNLSRAYGAELRPETLQCFERYVRAAEARMKLNSDRPGRFLYIDSLPTPDRQRIRGELRQSDIYVVRLIPRDEKGNATRASNGWIHHWLAAMFIPGATLKQAVAVDQEYDQYTSFYKPEIVRSRVLEHKGNTFKVYARLQKKTPWVTITLDTYSNVRYVFPDPQQLWSVSRSFRIQQVDDAGKPDEHLDPPGQGSGFLWAVDVYWRYEAVQGGIMVESETIALTRTVPFGLGWIIKPFVHRAAISTEKQLMIRTRQIIQHKTRKSARTSQQKGEWPGMPWLSGPHAPGRRMASMEVTKWNRGKAI